MKKQTISSLKKKAWLIFAQYIKLRDCLRATGSPEYGECITCNFSGHISRLQAGHFIPRTYNATLYSERNVHTQCTHCNYTLGGNVLEYRRQIIKLYGEGADLELEEEARQIKKFTLQELEALIIDLKEKIKEAE